MSLAEPSQPTEPIVVTEPNVRPVRLADSLLLIYADALDDLERTRIANENRLRSLIQVKGMGGTPEEARFQGVVDGLKALEHGAELELKRALRDHPLGPWVKRTVGIGEKQGARLLAAIGDPASRKTVSQLWAFCGFHVINDQAGQRNNDNQNGYASGHPGHSVRDTQPVAAGVKSSRDNGHTPTGNQGSPAGGDTHWSNDTQSTFGVAPSRRKGQKANWNGVAKMRAFLVAESCIKQRHSPYREVYDRGREKYVDAVHHHACVRCGPAGKPAPVGSGLNDGHKHARALRLVAKAILRDLWVEARRVAS